MTDKGPSRPSTTPLFRRRTTRLARIRHGKRFKSLVHGLVKVINSPIVITLISSVVVLLLTRSYEASQARSADLAKRRSDLERLVVELELRKDRLQIVCRQAADKKLFSTLEQANIGHRAKAIVAGGSNTVTSDPAYQNFHLATLLSQAEVTAGLQLTQRPELMEFTDRTDDSALASTARIFGQIKGPIRTIEQALNAGQIPIPQTEDEARPAPKAVAPSAAVKGDPCPD
jgi:hypothetical protein